MAARDDALAILREYGLEGLIGVIDNAIQADPTQFQGADATTNLWRTVRGTDQYKQRFKGLIDRQAKGFTPISESDYIQIEGEFRQVLRANGMPKGFYDTQDDFANFIANDVRADELNTRIQQGYRAVMDTEPGTKEELKRLYGLQDSDIAAYLIDPNRFTQTEAVKKAEAARRANAAREQQQQITAAQAEELVTRGISQQEAQQRFAEIAQTQELYKPLTGEEAITQQEQIAGTFGTSAAAAQRIATRKRQRKAEFEAGGSITGTTKGITGLTTANQ